MKLKIVKKVGPIELFEGVVGDGDTYSYAYSYAYSDIQLGNLVLGILEVINDSSVVVRKTEATYIRDNGFRKEDVVSQTIDSCMLGEGFELPVRVFPVGKLIVRSLSD